MTHLRFVLFVAMVGLFGCGASEETGGTDGGITHDLSTPEGAILCLEDAYRAQDVEAAVRCKDFQLEARLMLENINPELADEDLIAETANVLELAFRAQLKESPPSFDGVTSTFLPPQPYEGRTDIVQITETCTSGSVTSMNILHVAKTSEGWKVITIPEG